MDAATQSIEDYLVSEWRKHFHFLTKPSCLDSWWGSSKIQDKVDDEIAKTLPKSPNNSSFHGGFPAEPWVTQRIRTLHGAASFVLREMYEPEEKSSWFIKIKKGGQGTDMAAAFFQDAATQSIEDSRSKWKHFLTKLYFLGSWGSSKVQDKVVGSVTYDEIAKTLAKSPNNSLFHGGFPAEPWLTQRIRTLHGAASLVLREMDEPEEKSSWFVKIKKGGQGTGTQGGQGGSGQGGNQGGAQS